MEQISALFIKRAKNIVAVVCHRRTAWIEIHCGKTQFTSQGWCADCIKTRFYTKYYERNSNNKIGVLYNQIGGVNILRAFELEKGRFNNDNDYELIEEVDDNNNNNNSSSVSERGNMNSPDDNESRTSSRPQIKS
jgi:hypothetical protein